jgi:hypothetical protein
MHVQSRTLGRALFLLLVMALLSIAVSGASAQPAGPTPTPNDPLWRAYSAVRAALEERFSTDLQIVRNYEWEQVEFTGTGIDSCNPNDEQRALYFGWRFLITSLTGRQFEGRSSFDSTIIVACETVTTPAAPAAGATAAPAGNLPPPVAGSAAVGSFELGGHALELNANTVGLMRRAGMTWVKKQVRYALGQSPDSAIGIIQNAKANGFRVLLGVVGDPAQLGADFNNYINSYSDFVGGLAAAGADAIEVWNEPNIDREWPAGQINGATYTQLLARAYNAIKTRNPNTIVISGAPAPTGFFGAAGCAPQGCNDDAFMQQMAQAGAANYMDCIGLHYNEGILSPNAGSGDPRGNYPTYYFGSMLSRGASLFGGKPVCWTELGYLSGQGFSTPIPASFAWASNVTVAQQAAWLAEAATLSAQSGRVRLMIVWNVDFPFYTATDPMGGYAMFRPDGTCAACDTLGAVMRR